MANPTYTNATQPTIGNVAITDSCVQGIRANWQTAILDPNIALWLLGLSEDLIQQCYYLEEKSDVRGQTIQTLQQRIQGYKREMADLQGNLNSQTAELSRTRVIVRALCAENDTLGSRVDYGPPLTFVPSIPRTLATVTVPQIAAVPQRISELQPTPETKTVPIKEDLKDEDVKDEIKIKQEEDLPDFRETFNPRKRQRTDY